MDDAAALDFDALPHRVGAAVVGARKCSTTSPAAMLAVHPLADLTAEPQQAVAVRSHRPRCLR